LYYNGLSFRGIGDILGFHNTTILNWFKNYKYLFEDSQPSQFAHYEHVEIDELFTYLKKV
jgi:transposase